VSMAVLSMQCVIVIIALPLTNVMYTWLLVRSI
jgi:hypothetical protein